jgi:hypothetical protein
VLVTRKGAISAAAGQLGIIPGSMGTSSYIVRGRGNPESFCSASHGAGRRMSGGAAKKHFTLADLRAQTAGVECRKDAGVLDEIPGAYKDIDRVMANQADLVDVVARLRQGAVRQGLKPGAPPQVRHLLRSPLRRPGAHLGHSSRRCRRSCGSGPRCPACDESVENCAGEDRPEWPDQEPDGRRPEHGSPAAGPGLNV